MSTQHFTLTITLCFLLAPQMVLAQPAVDQTAAENLPQRGAISSNRGFGSDNRAVDTFGDVDLSGESSARPISGSVSRSTSRDWDVKVFNNTEDDYSVSLELTQFNRTGASLRKESFSTTLRAGGEHSRIVRARPGAEQTELKITNWTNLSERRRKADKVETGAAQEGEVVAEGSENAGN